MEDYRLSTSLCQLLPSTIFIFLFSFVSFLHFPNNQWDPPVAKTAQTKYLSFLTDPIARYLSFGLPGLGMFSEAYIIFSVGNIGNFQKWAFPACYAPNAYSGTACDQEVIHQKIDSYIQICGIMVRGRLDIDFSLLLY